MPAEWHPHQATWLSYPSNETTFPELDQVRRAYHDMISALLPEEEVHLLIDDERVEEPVRKALSSALPQERLVCHVLPTVDVWIRDYGPNFLLRQAKPAEDQNDGESRRGVNSAVGSHQRQWGRDGGRGSDAPPTPRRARRAEDHSADGSAQTAYNDWIFNAWGGKYDDLLADNSVPLRLEPILQMPRFAPGIVMEGGSIEVDGQGTCLTTEQCLLNPNRNPHLKRREIEEHLRDFLGVRRVLWLGEGIVGDDTDGHIDDIARFASADTIVCALEDDSADENYALLRDNLKRLKSFRRRDGRPYRIVTLPMPEAIREEDGTRLPASYANFYIANGVVLVPTFHDPNDAQALEALRDIFPGRRVQGIDCRQLVRGLGTLHCVTQQQPWLADESPPQDRN
ncbi:MAG TPA: agmatine deiminase family protein [Acidobacteriota bacterium]|nr:agmatine deiminase family protein [Acidobacteriota bacterium]